MTVRTLRRIEELVAAGAVVAGRRPHRSPSLADDDGEHARLCDALWGSGRVLDTDDVAEALRSVGAVPSLSVDGAELLRIRRRIEGGEVVFLANPRPEPVTVTLRTTSGRAPVAWDPVALRRETLRAGGAGVPLDLPALGSVFLVDDGPTEPPAGSPVAEVPLGGPWRLTLPGVLDAEIREPLPWTELGPEAAAFAGVGTYATELELAALPGRTAVLDLGDVGDLAQVRVNGTECGVAWMASWRVDVSGALRPGRNRIEIDVANTWMNRLIAEAGRPTGEIFPPVARVYAPDAPIRAFGLLSGVVLQLFS